jgi:hypothetical protein
MGNSVGVLPNFILGGVQKSGTTNLDGYLRNHPFIFMLERSMDYSFFDNNEIYSNGIDWYKSLFKNADGFKLIGQTSADCFFVDKSAERIHKHIPECKLIFILRSPIDRAYSHYWHQIKMAREYLSWEGAIKAEGRRKKKSYYYYRMFSYISRSRYKSLFDVYYEYFPKDQILLIPFEFMIKNELFVVNKVLNFLGLDSVERISDLIPPGFEKRTNPAKLPISKISLYLCYFIQRIGLIRISRYFLNLTLVEKRPPKMNDETRKMLEELFKVDIIFHKSLIEDWEEALKLSTNQA